MIVLDALALVVTVALAAMVVLFVVELCLAIRLEARQAVRRWRRGGDWLR